MAALVAAARSRLPEMWSAWVWVSTTCVILSPRRRANLRYSCTRSRPGSTTIARPAWPQPIRYERHPDSSLRICWKIIPASLFYARISVLLGFLLLGFGFLDDLLGQERHVRGVDVVVGTVVESHPEVDDRVAGVDPFLHAVADALLGGRDVVARHRAAEDVVHELEAAPARQRLDPEPDVAVLAAAARLLLVLALPLGAPLDRLLVRDARREQVHVHVVLALHALHDHLDVEAAHARDEELLRLGVVMVVDGRVLLGDARQRLRDLGLVPAPLGLDRQRDGRPGEDDPRQLEGLRLVAERVARQRLLELLGNADLAGAGRV